MYQNLSPQTNGDGSMFISKWLTKNGVYNLSYAPNSIRIQPYDGTGNYHYLRRVSNINELGIPAVIKRGAGLKNKAYVLQVDDMFYLVHPDFRGDPTALTYSEAPQFPIIDAPKKEFYEEAATATPEPLTVKDYTGHRHPKYIFDKTMRKSISLKLDNNIAISIYMVGGRRWLEVRKDDSGSSRKYFLNEHRILGESFIPELSGITVGTSYKDNGANLAALCFPDWNVWKLFTWYSETRNAIIIEGAPEKCAICGETIRTIEPEHFSAAVCPNCEPHLGEDGAINGIAMVKKLLRKYA